MEEYCKTTQLVLVGYSQGAMAVHQAELKMTTTELSRIRATLLIADGDKAPNSRATLFGAHPAAAKSEGIRDYVRFKTGDVRVPSRSANLCDVNDIVCDFNFSHFPLIVNGSAIHVHTHYTTDELNHLGDFGASKLTPIPRPVVSPAPSRNGSYTIATPTSGPGGFAVSPKLDPCPPLAGDPKQVILSMNVNQGNIYAVGSASTTDYNYGFALTDPAASSGQATTRFSCAIDDGSVSPATFKVTQVYTPDLTLTVNAPGGTLTSTPPTSTTGPSNVPTATIHHGDVITLSDSGNGCTYVTGGNVVVQVDLNSNANPVAFPTGPIDSAGHWGPINYTIPADTTSTRMQMNINCEGPTGSGRSGSQRYDSVVYNIQ